MSLNTDWLNDDFVRMVRKVLDDESSEFIGHDALAVKLLNDSDSAAIVQQVAIKQGKSSNWVAEMIVSHFSRLLAAEQTTWRNQYERVRKSNRWAYRSLTT
ncbi:MAG TPA: hypothetical protein DDW52_09490 [Planctomycetaceae bacterium]|nr:hypothetical protein [Planctomycetaceae bacterium]